MDTRAGESERLLVRAALETVSPRSAPRTSAVNSTLNDDRVAVAGAADQCG